MHSRPIPTLLRELELLTSILHRRLYADFEGKPLRSHLSRLERLIRRIPEDDGSILGAEVRAIRDELCGNYEAALLWRHREVELMHALYADMASHPYDESTKEFMLRGRDRNVLAFRHKIIRSIRAKLRKEVSGKTRMKSAGSANKSARTVGQAAKPVKAPR